MSLRTIWQQFYPANAPTYTEKELAREDLTGKVFIITGANSGIGKQLTKFLYPTGATIYLAGRSEERIKNAIAEIISTAPSSESNGTLKALHGLDLADLRTIKPVFQKFAAQEKELHVLWNNAAMPCDPGASTPQGIEGHMGANAVGPFLFTQLLVPLLSAGARTSKVPSRIVWTGSVQIEMNAPAGGIDFARLEGGKTIRQYIDYAASKCGNLFLAHEGGKRWSSHGIISVCQNPGNMYTGLYVGEHWLFVKILKAFVLYGVEYGAYTMLFAGFSDKVTQAQNGCYIWPWGVIKPNSRMDVLQAIEEGKARYFWEWCETRTSPFM